MSRALVVVVAGLLGACGNGASTSAPTGSASPALPVSAPSGTGRVITTKLESAALGVEKDVVVYLPAGYDAAPAKRWPVFYYLHGLGGDETNWISGGKLAEVADAMKLAAIVVMPDGDNGFYTDSSTPIDHAACMASGAGLLDPRAPRKKTCVREPRYETYITKDLVAWVDASYRTIATRDGRAIAGLSMGGFGALKLSMRHPDLFAAAASHSGVDALLYAGPFPYVAGKVTLETDPRAWGGKLGPFGAWVRGIFGTDLATWRAHDPAALVETLTPGALALYLDVGTEDELALHNGALYVHDLLTAKNIEHAWYIGPGHHDFSFWAARLPHSLAFLRDHVAAAN